MYNEQLPPHMCINEKSGDWYQRLRKKALLLADQQGMEKLAEVILLIPDFIILLYRLAKDKRVPKDIKLLALGALMYTFSPLDIIPDWLSVIGLVDDMYIISLVVNEVLNKIDQDILDEHWSGQKPLLNSLQNIAMYATSILKVKQTNRLIKFFKSKLMGKKI